MKSARLLSFRSAARSFSAKPTANTVITPVDLSTKPSATARDAEVTRIVQLLVTLCGDTDKMALSQSMLDNAAKQAEVAVQSLNDAELLAIAKKLDGSKLSLATAAVAQDHLESNLKNVLAGTWIQGDPTSNSVLAITFVDKDHYVGIEKNPTRTPTATPEWKWAHIRGTPTLWTSRAWPPKPRTQMGTGVLTSAARSEQHSAATS